MPPESVSQGSELQPTLVMVIVRVPPPTLHLVPNAGHFSLPHQRPIGHLILDCRTQGCPHPAGHVHGEGGEVCRAGPGRTFGEGGAHVWSLFGLLGAKDGPLSQLCW